MERLLLPPTERVPPPKLLFCVPKGRFPLEGENERLGACLKLPLPTLRLPPNLPLSGELNPKFPVPWFTVVRVELLLGAFILPKLRLPPKFLFC